MLRSPVFSTKNACDVLSEKKLNISATSLMATGSFEAWADNDVPPSHLFSFFTFRVFPDAL